MHPPTKPFNLSLGYRFQAGGTIAGLLIGLVVGLGLALAVAVYVTKVPLPSIGKAPSRTAEQDAAESRKNKDWDPNAPLYGKNPMRPATAASGAVGGASGAGPAQASASAPSGAASAPQVAASAARPAASAADPLGDLARARAAADPVADPFDYYVQVGAYRNAEEAESQRVRLTMLGWEPKVTEREQAGRTVFRVRTGPYRTKADADQAKERLEGAGLETALVRVQRP